MSLPLLLNARLRGRVVVVGIGNPLRGDDAAGCLLVARLRPSARLRPIRAEEVPENVLEPIVAARPDTVLFVDAVELGAEPGAAALLGQGQLRGYQPTTHRVPLDLVMEYVRRRTGAEVLLLAIQPGGTDFGRPVSPAVERSARLLAAAIQEAAAGPLGAFQAPEEAV